MLEYPSETAKNKHDLICHKEIISGTALQDVFGFENTGAIFQALAQEIPKGLTTLSNVYSYHDAPDPPLSRSLIVIGVADTSLSIVRKLVGGDDDDGDRDGDDAAMTPDCPLHKCLVAVKRADGHHLKSLESKYVAHSKAFGTFMQRLRSEGLVAILALDKYKRFGILKPVPIPVATAAGSNSNGNGGSSHGGSHLQVQDCFATIHVGNVNYVKSFLRGNVAAATAAVACVEGSSSYRPQTPPVEEMDYSGSGDLWQPPGTTTTADSSTGLWQPPGGDSSSGGGGGGDLWKPPGDDSNNNQQDYGDYSTDNIWGTSNDSAADTSNGNKKRAWQEEEDEDEQNDEGGEKFHSNAGAAAADKFYSGLKRTLDTRADSYLYHMRSFNGWVKATQIQELDPKAKDAQGKPNPHGPMRILDLACGKGGDLGKWVLHPRGLCNYVGSDVARGSLQDAAIRVRGMRQKLKQCTFTCADLGHDVPGRLRSAKHKQMQKLLTVR
jgi:mRNA (guanine-N7-)-methyltransferase